MIKGFFVLASFQLAGEAIVKAMRWPVPGPVLGMIGLVIVLLAMRHWRNEEPALDPGSSLSRASDGILGALGLLFVPAGVGVMQQGSLLLSRGPVLVVVLVVSTVLTLLVTVGTFLLVSRLLGTAEQVG
jgi:holin-like protein